MLEKILRFTEKLIPKKIYHFFQPAYHYLLAIAAAMLYRFPSRKIKVIVITGTKGKTSTVEIINAILEESGYKTALSSTLRIKIGEESIRNKYKMTIPGRFFLQKFLRKAVNEKCEYAIIEMTSEGAKQFRHKFIAFDALVFTNLAREHIESHGSFENYADAKLSIARALGYSKKKKKAIIANIDDAYGKKFLEARAERKASYAISDAEPYEIKKEGLWFTFAGKKVSSSLSGEFNLYNILAAIRLAETQEILNETIVRTIEKFKGIPGRMEKIDMGQDFTIIVDYAHTPDSLEKVYEVFGHARKICVLGGTGGGRDKWKRPEMGAIAARHCEHIILTNEDPYDEDPQEIINDIKEGIHNKPLEIIIDRRQAVARALSLAKTGDAVIITGKGTDPYIMVAKGNKIPWSDAGVAKEEIKKAFSGQVFPPEADPPPAEEISN